MNTDTLATLADSSSLLLGLHRPLAKVQVEPSPLPLSNPVPGYVSGIGETTRERRNVTFSDAGRKQSDDRFASEHQFAALPICDQFDTFGSASRMDGRQPIMKKI